AWSRWGLGLGGADDPGRSIGPPSAACQTGISPIAMIEHARMGDSPSAFARATRAPDSAPGLIHSSAGAFAAPGSSKPMPIDAGTYIDTTSTGPGTSAMVRY